MEEVCSLSRSAQAGSRRTFAVIVVLTLAVAFSIPAVVPVDAGPALLATARAAESSRVPTAARGGGRRRSPSRPSGSSSSRWSQAAPSASRPARPTGTCCAAAEPAEFRAGFARAAALESAPGRAVATSSAAHDVAGCRSAWSTSAPEGRVGCGADAPSAPKPAPGGRPLFCQTGAPWQTRRPPPREPGPDASRPPPDQLDDPRHERRAVPVATARRCAARQLPEHRTPAAEDGTLLTPPP